MLAEEKRNHILRKHTAVIHISNDLNAVERKIYNVLLSNVKNCMNNDMFAISIDSILSALGYDLYKNYTYIKSCIMRLVDTSIRLNILGKDKKKKWESAISLLSSVHFSDGIVYYSLPQELSNMIIKPSIYAALNLNYQQKLSSKYSLAFWEFCTEQLDTGQYNKSSTILSLDQLRELLGANEKSYDDYKEFNKKILKIIIKDINDLTDLIVSVISIKSGRKVVKLSFTVSRKPEFIAINNELKDKSFIKQNEENIINDQILPLYEKGNKLGIDKVTLDDLYNKFDEKKVNSALDSVVDIVKKGKKINNVVGYILKILQIGIYQSVSSEELSKNIYHDEIQEKESRSNLNANNIVKTFFNDCRIKWGDAIYKSWILHLQYIQHNDEQVVFTVNSNFIKKWLDENYAGYFLKLWQSYIPSIKQFIIQVVKN
jgi:plasmid replication initiation protein